MIFDKNAGIMDGESALQGTAIASPKRICGEQ
jgi:hypothetical protein